MVARTKISAPSYSKSTAGKTNTLSSSVFVRFHKFKRVFLPGLKRPQDVRRRTFLWAAIFIIGRISDIVGQFLVGHRDLRVPEIFQSHPLCTVRCPNVHLRYLKNTNRRRRILTFLMYFATKGPQRMAALIWSTSPQRGINKAIAPSKGTLS